MTIQYNGQEVELPIKKLTFATLKAVAPHLAVIDALPSQEAEYSAAFAEYLGDNPEMLELVKTLQSNPEKAGVNSDVIELSKVERQIRAEVRTRLPYNFDTVLACVPALQAIIDTDKIADKALVAEIQSPDHSSSFYENLNPEEVINEIVTFRRAGRI